MSTDTGVSDIIEHAFIVELERAAVDEVVSGADDSDDPAQLISDAAMVAGRMCLERIVESGEFYLHGQLYRVAKA